MGLERIHLQRNFKDFPMKKFLLSVTTLLATILVNTNALAVGIKNNDEKLPAQCKKLFSETDKLVADAKNQPGTHTQINQIQSKLNQSKKQILEMELATQIKSCDHGLAKLASLNKVQLEDAR